MNGRHAALVGLLATALVLLGGAVTLLGADSPCDGNVDVESYPVGPERPLLLGRRLDSRLAVETPLGLLDHDERDSRAGPIPKRVCQSA